MTCVGVEERKAWFLYLPFTEKRRKKGEEGTAGGREGIGRSISLLRKDSKVK